MQTDPEIAFPVEAVVDTHHMLAVADLLENQLVADVDQIAHAGHFHGKNFFGRLLDRFVSEKNEKWKRYTTLKPPSPITSLRPR